MGFIPLEEDEPGRYDKLLICECADGAAGLRGTTDVLPSRALWLHTLPPTGLLLSRVTTASGKDVHSLAVNGGLSDYEYASKAWLLAG